MTNVKVIEIKKSVFENNDREADRLRSELKAEKTFLLTILQCLFRHIEILQIINV